MTDYSQPSFSISIEEEYQFIDPHSRELRGFATAQGLTLHEERETGSGASPLTPRSMGTPACQDVKQARRELLRVRRSMRELADSHSLKLMAAGVHPFSLWEHADEESPRYRALIEDTQFIARRLLAFGMYVHVGIDDRNLAIDVMNAIRYLLPHILCLANSSPLLARPRHGAGQLSLRPARRAAPHRHSQRLQQPQPLSQLRRYPPAYQQHPRS